MAMKVRKQHPRVVPCWDDRGKRFYFSCVNGIRVSVRARNGLLAVKQLPSWVLL